MQEQCARQLRDEFIEKYGSSRRYDDWQDRQRGGTAQRYGQQFADVSFAGLAVFSARYIRVEQQLSVRTEQRLTDGFGSGLRSRPQLGWR